MCDCRTVSTLQSSAISPAIADTSPPVSQVCLALRLRHAGPMSANEVLYRRRCCGGHRSRSRSHVTRSLRNGGGGICPPSGSRRRGWVVHARRKHHTRERTWSWGPDKWPNCLLAVAAHVVRPQCSRRSAFPTRRRRTTFLRVNKPFRLLRRHVVLCWSPPLPPPALFTLHLVANAIRTGQGNGHKSSSDPVPSAADPEKHGAGQGTAKAQR